jgi:hypothetical protein
VTAIEPDDSTRRTLAMFIGPEVVALILVLVLAPIVGLLITLSQHGTRPEIVVPSQAAVAQSPSPSPSGPAALNLGPARNVLATVDRLLQVRAALEKQIPPHVGDAASITNLLGQLNQVVTGADEAGLAAMAADARTQPLARKISLIEHAAAATAQTTQGASLTNTQAYVRGAADVVVTLGPLVGLRQELVTLIGAPNASASPATASPQASAPPAQSAAPGASQPPGSATP